MKATFGASDNIAFSAVLQSLSAENHRAAGTSVDDVTDPTRQGLVSAVVEDPEHRNGRDNGRASECDHDEEKCHCKKKKSKRSFRNSWDCHCHYHFQKSCSMSSRKYV